MCTILDYYFYFSSILKVTPIAVYDSSSKCFWKYFLHLFMGGHAYYGMPLEVKGSSTNAGSRIDLRL